MNTIVGFGDWYLTGATFTNNNYTPFHLSHLFKSTQHIGEVIERQLQQNLNKIENWATSNGFKFSKSKTQCVHFCQLRKQHDDPFIHLYGSPIPVVEESKFLGILFYRKLSFIPHIKYLKAKCLKALNLLKVLSHTSWGADRTTLLKLYRSLVRSKLDYGCIIYGSDENYIFKCLILYITKELG